jgi:uncharacterized membrane protein HdeD (DUF308 family)
VNDPVGSLVVQKVNTAAPLRTLYFVRTGFSIVWVALVFLLAATVTTATPPTAVAVLLLAVYPVWDAVATFLDARASAAEKSHLVQYLNIVAGLAAGTAILVAAGSGLTAMLIVFGAWASVSGAVQLTLALRRRKPVGGQWPMIISGGLSVLAGISFMATSGAPHTSLTTIAGYSAFGAFWYLFGAILLIRAAQRTRTA